MNYTNYFSIVLKRFERYYTVTPNVSYGGILFDSDAVFSVHEDQTVLFKENVMDYSNSIEHCLFKYEPELSVDGVRSIVENFPVFSRELTNPSRYHKCTVIKVILVTDGFTSPQDEQFCTRMTKKFYFSKVHAFYLHGWTEGYLYIEDISHNNEYKNRRAGKSSYRI
ncbi:MAG: hypothetical protein LKF96_09205 [Treponema sp.]|jgi:hypothetical protein|nr:hypothetical protein [Treponema sp.]